MLELKKLRTFLKIVETGSFSKAAEELNYSQSTVTVQIQQLEEELNIHLFDRFRNGVELTEKGREIEKYAREMIDISNEATKIGRGENEIKGDLRISAMDSISARVLPPIIKMFRELLPEVNVLVQKVDSSADAEQQLAKNEVDIALIASESNTIHAKGLGKIFLEESNLVFVASQDCPLVKNGIIATEQLMSQTVIISEKTGLFLMNSDKQSIKHRGTILCIANSFAALEMAKLNVGIAYLPYFLVENLVEKGELFVFNTPGIEHSVWVQALFIKQKYMTVQMQVFFDLIKKYYHIP